MNVNSLQLKHIISQNNGHLYDYGKDGFIVTDLSAKEMLHLPLDEKNSIERVEQFFSDISRQQVDQNETAAKPVTWFDVGIPFLSDAKQMAACGKAIMEMVEHHSIIVKIHFDKDPISWQDLLSPFIESLQEEMKKGVVKLQLYGTFARMKTHAMDFLFDNRIQIYYVSKTPTSKRSFNNIYSLAEYGFRVPCVWYVDKKNIDLIPSLIVEAMEWNYDAGFSLPLASERIVGCTKNNPSNVDYLRLILNVYKKYQCYDDVFYPMNMALLESIGATRDSRVRTWRWNGEHSSFYEHVNDSSIDRIRNILRRSFVWQRHIVKNKLEPFLSNACYAAGDETQEHEVLDNAVK